MFIIGYIEPRISKNSRYRRTNIKRIGTKLVRHNFFYSVSLSLSLSFLFLKYVPSTEMWIRKTAFDSLRDSHKLTIETEVINDVLMTCTFVRSEAVLLMSTLGLIITHTLIKASIEN